jgi:hypothetical protein
MMEAFERGLEIDGTETIEDGSRGRRQPGRLEQAAIAESAPHVAAGAIPDEERPPGVACEGSPVWKCVVDVVHAGCHLSKGLTGTECWV